VIFESLANTFLSFFQLPVHHDTRLELLYEFKQRIFIHIADHIHEWRLRRSLCKAETTKEQCLELFLKSLVSIIAKDIASPFPHLKHESINKAQQFDLIYAQSGYLYTVLPDAPRPIPFGHEKPGMSHVVDGLICSMTHHNPSNQLPPIYDAPQYLQPYGGPSHYPPPIHQQSYPVVPPQPLGGTPLVPQMHLVSQSSVGPPPTPTCDHNSCGGTSTSYTPYGLTPKNNPYFPFPDPPWLVTPPQGHPDASVNFVHPSPIQ